MNQSAKMRQVFFVAFLGSVSALAPCAHWTVKGTYQGTYSGTVGGQTTTYTWPAGTRTAMQPLDLSVSPGQTGNYSLNVTFTILLTWTLDSGDTAQSAPTPTALWLYQSALASAKGNGMLAASDGLSDTPQTSTEPDSIPKKTSTAAIKSHLVNVSVSSGTVTISDTITASGSHHQYPVYSGTAVVGPFADYSVSIHAQPYGMYKTSSTPQSNGDLDFRYNWLSTTGNKADLDKNVITMYERVVFPGGSPYIPPAPFDQNQLNNPGHGNSWKPTDADVLDVHQVPLITKPYSAGSFTGTQKYYFDDTETVETMVLLLGPFNIVRRVQLTGLGWYYIITKDGEINSIPLP